MFTGLLSNLLNQILVSTIKLDIIAKIFYQFLFQNKSVVRVIQTGATLKSSLENYVFTNKLKLYHNLPLLSIRFVERTVSKDWTIAGDLLGTL